MIAELKGPIFGPYYCSSCRMKQPQNFHYYCFFCGEIFSNYEEIIINEEIERQAMEGENDNENNLYRKN